MKTKNIVSQYDKRDQKNWSGIQTVRTYEQDLKDSVYALTKNIVSQYSKDQTYSQ